MPQTALDIKNYIQLTLGLGVVEVELIDDQLNMCIDEATRWFQTYSGQRKGARLTPFGKPNEFPVPNDYDAGGEVVFSGTGGFEALYSGFDFNMLDVIGGPYPTVRGGVVSYSDYVQSMQYIEMGQRLFGGDQSWEFDEDLRVIRVFPARGYTSGYIYLIYKPSALAFVKLSSREYFLIRRYSYAHALENLSMIRSKYMSLPSATGELSLNGDLLASNADMMKTHLDEEIRKLRRPIGFITG